MEDIASHRDSCSFKLAYKLCFDVVYESYGCLTHQAQNHTKERRERVPVSVCLCVLRSLIQQNFRINAYRLRNLCFSCFHLWDFRQNFHGARTCGRTQTSAQTTAKHTEHTKGEFVLIFPLLRHLFAYSLSPVCSLTTRPATDSYLVFRMSGNRCRNYLGNMKIALFQNLNTRNKQPEINIKHANWIYLN